MPDSDVKNKLLNHIQQTNTIPLILSSQYVLSYPEAGFKINGKIPKIELKGYSEQDISDAKLAVTSGFNSTNKDRVSQEIIQYLIDLNHSRIDILASAMKNYNEFEERTISNFGYQSKHSPILGPKGDKPISFIDFIEDNKNKGITYGKPELVTTHDGYVFLASKISIDGGDPTFLPLFTNKLSSLTADQKSLLLDEFKLTLDSLKTLTNFSDINKAINNSIIGKFLQSNTKTMIDDNILNKTFKVNGVDIKLANFFTIGNGNKINVINKYPPKTSIEIRAYQNLFTILNTYLTNSNSNSDYMLLDNLRFPFNKNDDNDFTNYQVYHERVNYQSSHIIMNLTNNNETNSEEPDFSIKTNDKIEGITIIEAKQIISNILGEQASEEWSEFKQNLTHKGIELFGMMFNGKLYYDVQNGLVNKSTVRHEIYHLITDNFLSEDSRQKIYSEARKAFKGGESMSIKQLDETLADWYGDNGNTYNVKRYSGFLGKLRMLLDKILGRYKLYSGELGKYFNKIESGAYKDSFTSFARDNGFNHKDAKYSTKTEYLDDEAIYDNDINEADQEQIDEEMYDETKLNYEAKMSLELDLLLGNKLIHRTTTYFKQQIKKASLFTGGKYTFNESIDRLYNIFGESENKEVVLNDGNTYKLSDLNRDHIPFMNMDIMINYVKYQFKYNRIFKDAIMKRMFPSIDLNNFKIKSKTQAYQLDSKPISFVERTPEIVNWFNSSISRYSKDGKLLKGVIEEKQVTAIMSEAAIKMNLYNSENDFLNLTTSLRSLIKNDNSLKDEAIRSILFALIDNPIKNNDSQENTKISLFQSYNNEFTKINNSSKMIDNIIATEVQFLNRKGERCAASGAVISKFQSGGKWDIVNDLTGFPSHQDGGVNISFSNGVEINNNGVKIKAENGLIIKNK
jgi:hypothetical protein